VKYKVHAPKRACENSITAQNNPCISRSYILGSCITIYEYEQSKSANISKVQTTFVSVRLRGLGGVGRVSPNTFECRSQGEEKGCVFRVINVYILFLKYASNIHFNTLFVHEHHKAER